MFVKIERENRDISVYGVTDFQTDGSGVVTFSPEETYYTGRVKSAVEESRMDVKSIHEAMLHSLTEGDVEVFTGNINQVDEALEEFNDTLDEEYDRDVEDYKTYRENSVVFQSKLTD